MISFSRRVQLRTLRFLFANGFSIIVFLLNCQLISSTSFSKRYCILCKLNIIVLVKMEASFKYFSKDTIEYE
uniref:Uncharacterized protein n=1 Tax=Arundo donax TaxID=35708 RepID=A0A0A9GSQ9_ARUDO